jgi:hypothetical protein
MTHEELMEDLRDSLYKAMLEGDYMAQWWWKTKIEFEEKFQAIVDEINVDAEPFTGPEDY